MAATTSAGRGVCGPCQNKAASNALLRSSAGPARSTSSELGAGVGRDEERYEEHEMRNRLRISCKTLGFARSTSSELGAGVGRDEERYEEHEMRNRLRISCKTLGFAGQVVARQSSRNEEAQMHKIGYARVSSQDQNLDRQIAALRAEKCERIFREKASGKEMRNRPELEKAIDALPTKGVLVLAEWDRATRSLMDGISIMQRVHKRGAYIKVLDRPGLDLTTPTGRGILALLSGLAEEERERIMRRANEGRRAAIKRGTKLGRKPKLDDHQQQEARKRLKAGESCREVAKSYRVHHSTVARLQG